MDQIAGETVDFQGVKYTAIREGSARILTPYQDPQGSGDVHRTSRNNNNNTGNQAVFYNKIQQFNRDLTVLAILVHGEGALVEKSAKLEKKLKDKKKQKERRAHSHQAASTVALDPQYAGGRTVRACDGLDKVPEHDDASNKRRRNNSVDSCVDESSKQDGGLRKRLRTEENTGDVEPVAQDADTVQHSLTEPTNEMQIQARRKPPYAILDALSATGLRSLRYAKEIPFATTVVANDLLPEAVSAIERNVRFNEVGHVVTVNKDDARAFMYAKVGNELPVPPGASYVHRFDVVDLDPYGTAAPFFDAALQSLQDGGLLCVTCTDAGVFASNGYPEKAYLLYAGTTMKGTHSHEAGLRLILHAISLSAGKYGIAVEPLLSLSIDFYVRLFIRIHKRPNEAKLLSGTSMLTYNCDQGCGAWAIQKIGRNTTKEAKNGERYFHYSYAQGPSVNSKCEHCGFKTHLAGPMWAGPLHNPFFLRAMLGKLPSLDRNVYGTVDRLEGMLRTAIEEDITVNAKTFGQSDNTKQDGCEEPLSALIPRLPPEAEDPVPFFFSPGYLCKVLHTSTPKEALLKSAFIALGYKVTRSHCKPGSFKTNAPWDVIWEIFREWVRQHSPQKVGALKPGTAGYEIMKRTRGRDSAKVLLYKEELFQRLSKASDVDTLKSEMEAAMFRLRDVSSERPCEPTNNGCEEDGKKGETGEKDLRDKKPADLRILFDEKLGKETKEKIVRYQVNLPHWGPMNRATGKNR